MPRIFITLIVLLAGLFTRCLAQPLITFHSDNQTINIGPQIAMLQDTLEQYTIRDVVSKPIQGKFVNSHQQIPNFGSSTKPVWCRFMVKNSSGQKLVLMINNTEIEYIDLYIDKQKYFIHKKLSAYQPFNKRDILVNKYLLNLEVPQDSVQVYYMRLQTSTGLQFPLRIFTLPALIERQHTTNLLFGLYFGIMVVMLLYNLFIYFSTSDASYLFYVLYVAFMTLTNLVEKGLAFEFFWPAHPGLNRYVNVAACFTGIFAALFSISFLKLATYARGVQITFYGLILCYLVTIGIIVADYRFIGMVLTEVISVITTLVLLYAGIITYYKNYQPAQYYLIAWTLLLISVVVFVLKDYNIVPYNSFTVNSMTIGSAIEAMLLSLALANKINTYKEEKDNAQLQALKSLEENRKLITEQNALLEKSVEERTIALKRTNNELTMLLQNLKETQAQLIQREKMASLGELTAGIAHEIQNPLNFINNFSELSMELADELKENITKLKGAPPDLQNTTALISDLIDNQQKINIHGKRADAIVKGMLQHSRKSDGQKEMTDINALAEDFLRLSYHGVRVKNKGFNAYLTTHFDPAVGKISVVPQEIGRVLLNLFNNAFYAVQEKAANSDKEYKPQVIVSTLNKGDHIEVKVKDNGTGIPAEILDKIYQPFFTTKPAGQGTGLGLSLSYDIITKSHNGDMQVTTKLNEFTEFTVLLPIE